MLPQKKPAHAHAGSTLAHDSKLTYESHSYASKKVKVSTFC